MASWHCTSCGWLFAAAQDERAAPHTERDCPECGRAARMLRDRSDVMEMFSPRRPADGRKDD